MFRCYYLSGKSIVLATYVDALDEDRALLLARLLCRDKLHELPIDNLEIWQDAKMITSAPCG